MIYAIASTSAFNSSLVIVLMQRLTSKIPSANAIASRIAFRVVTPRPLRIARITRGSPSTKRARKSIRPL
jgi:hypothetical protein